MDLGLERRRGYRGGLAWTVTVIAFVLTILMVTPFQPTEPYPGIDGSWHYAMNVAVANHLRFGRDILFTFGPLASVYTRSYHPATDTAMIVGSVLIAVSVFLGLFALVEPRRRPLLLLLPLVVSLGWGRDALFLFLPALLPFVAKRNVERGRASSVTLHIVAVAAAMLPLVKANFSLMVVVSTLCAMALLWKRSRATAMMLCVIQLVTVVAAWLLSGQVLGDLPTYFFAQGPIISGYTDGMSRDGQFSDVVIFVLASTAMLAIMVAARLWRTVFAIVILGLYLFIAFKSGFIRHDGHALMPAVALVYAGLLLILDRAGRAGVSALVIGLLGWAIISGNYQDNKLSGMTARFAAMVQRPVEGIWFRFTQPDRFIGQFRAATAAMGQSALFAGYRGTADLYPMDIAPMTAAGVTWNPRPILQSYSAYTPSLVAANAAHLTTDAVSRVYFKIDPIDNHYPSLDDGLSWLSLLSRFRPTAFEQDYAVLDRDWSRDTGLVSEPGGSLDAAMGEDIRVPVAITGKPVWVSIDVTPSLVGKVFSAMYKLPELSLVVRYADGESASYRFIPGMGRTGFLLSPTVTNARDFIAMRSSYRDDLLSKRRVVALSIFGQSGTRFLWNTRYKVTFSGLEVDTLPEADRLLSGSWRDSPPLESYAKGGDCTIDEVDYVQAPSGYINLGPHMVTFRGWAALDAANGRANTGISLVFTGRDGVTQILAGAPKSRPDVVDAFHQASLANAGYEADVDVRKLPEISEVRVMQRDGGRELVCASPVLTIHRVSNEIATGTK